MYVMVIKLTFNFFFKPQNSKYLMSNELLNLGNKFCHALQNS
jgi:hypothetical protein